MNQIMKEEGLFAVDEQMPCSPNSITVYHYAIPSSLGKAELEEAAARILSFSQKLGQWVGISVKLLSKMFKDEFETQESIEEMRKQNFDDQQRFEQASQKHRSLCRRTLGIYGLFATKPTAKLREIPKTEIFTGIHIFGIQFVMNGMDELIDKEFVKLVRKGEDGNDFDSDLLFPTAKLASLIMQKQGVAAK